MIGRRLSFGASLEKLRKRVSKCELVGLPSTSRQTMNMKDVKVTGNRR